MTMQLTLTETPEAPPAESRAYGAIGAARQLWACRANEVLIEGPAGTGKTRAVLEKVYWLAHRWPGSRHLLLRQTRASMTQSVLVTWEDKVVQPGGIDGDASRAHRSNYRIGASEIVVGGLDNPDRIMSTEYDTINVFEATEITEEAWEKLLTRLRNNVMPYQQAVADCNPGPPGHWLNQRAARGQMRRLLSRHEDNPSLTPEYLGVLSKLTGHRRARLYEGRWVAGEGSVYPEFDAERHVMAPFVIPATWPIYWGYDAGFDHPTAILWFAIAPNGTLYIIDELYDRQHGAEYYAKVVREREQAMGRYPVRRYADPQHVFSKTAQAPKSLSMQWNDLGFRLTPWPRTGGNEESMVEAVRQLFASDKLKIFNRCRATIADHQSWAYKRTGKGEVPPGEDRFEDANNDCCDVVKGVVAAHPKFSPSDGYMMVKQGR